MWYIYALRLKIAHIFMESKRKPFINVSHLSGDVFAYHDEDCMIVLENTLAKSKWI